MSPAAAMHLPRTMPALSIRQPWAWLIVHGHKDVENRDWPTPLRKPFLVHAGLTLTRPYYERTAQELDAMGLLPAAWPRFEALRAECGGIVGEARVTDCVSESASRWFVPGGYGFLLADAKPLPFRPVTGRLGFFDVELPAR